MPMLETGDVAQTQWGTTTTPFPKVATGPRQIKATLKRVDDWLLENAVACAKHQGKDFCQHMFECLRGHPLSQGDRDTLNEYLFGEA